MRILTSYEHYCAYNSPYSYLHANVFFFNSSIFELVGITKRENIYDMHKSSRRVISALKYYSE